MNDEYDKTEKPPVEDWEMSELNLQLEQNTVAENFDITLVGMNSPSTPAATEDWSMNVPNTNPIVEKPPDGWEMPPPVFRISSGKKLDKSTRKTPPPNAGDSPDFQTQPAEVIVPNPDIQPQPYISEELSVNEVISKTYVKPKKSSSKLIMIIIGLIVMTVIAVAFAGGVYYWFFYKPE